MDSQDYFDSLRADLRNAGNSLAKDIADALVEPLPQLWHEAKTYDLPSFLAGYSPLGDLLYEVATTQKYFRDAGKTWRETPGTLRDKVSVVLVKDAENTLEHLKQWKDNFRVYGRKLEEAFFGPI